MELTKKKDERKEEMKKLLQGEHKPSDSVSQNPETQAQKEPEKEINSIAKPQPNVEKGLLKGRDISSMRSKISGIGKPMNSMNKGLAVAPLSNLYDEAQIDAKKLVPENPDFEKDFVKVRKDVDIILSVRKEQSLAQAVHPLA